MVNCISYLPTLAIVMLHLHSFASLPFVSNEGDPAEWALEWNGIGNSNNGAHGYERSWKGIGISEAEKAELISKIRSQTASEVYAGLKSRPTPKLSDYGTCMVGIVNGMPTFWVQGMYGAMGHSGYPKNPKTGDGTGHLRGCYYEHQLTGLCAYSDVAERAKQTLLYAVENDVCTNYYNLKFDNASLNLDLRYTSNISVKKSDEDSVQERAKKFLSRVGLFIPPTGSGGDTWIRLCEVRARVANSGLKRRHDTRSCLMTTNGEILETRVTRLAEWSCSYHTEIYASGTLLQYQNQIIDEYNDGINLALDAKDKMAANVMESMKRQHLQNLRVASNKDTAKLTATAESAPYWGGGGNCDLVLEGRVRNYF